MNFYGHMEIGIGEDYLLPVFRSCCFAWFSAKLTSRLMLFQWAGLQLLTATGIYEIFLGNTEVKRKLLPNWMFIQMCSLLYLIGSILCKQIQKSPAVIKMQSWSWILAGDEVYKKLLLETRHFKLVCGAIFFLFLAAGITMAPIIGGEEDWQIASFIWNKYFGNEKHYIFRITYLSSSISFLIFNPSLICVSLYAIRHMEFQYTILNAALRRLHTKSIYHMNDVRYQEKVDGQLKNCIEMHLVVKKLTTTLLDGTNNLVLSLMTYGVAVFAFTSSIILSGMDPSINYRLYFTIAAACFILWAFCEYCQRLINESNNVFINACRCPWEQYNNHNRRTFMMLLLNSSKPLIISCHGLVNADYGLALKVCRMTYAFYTMYKNLG